MIKIGLFSQMNRVTVKALRHYDEMGLLKPSHVDRWTGYRYYSASQIPRLHRIITLKQIGCSISEIKDLLDRDPDTAEMAAFLQAKVVEQSQAVAREQAVLGRIQAYLQVLTQESNHMNYNVILKELPQVIVASKRITIPNYDAMFTEAPAMGEIMKKQGARCALPEYCFNLYHDGEYKEKDIDVEICEAVVEARPESDGVSYKTVAAVPTAACVIHKGPYQRLKDAYGIIMKWIEENNYEIVGLPRESYIDGIWNKEDPEEWLTEIQIPVEAKRK